MRELDAKVAEKVFGLNVGYYGPPSDGKWNHIESIRHDTQEQAKAAYAIYWDKFHKENPIGVIGRDELETGPCTWVDGWGPLAVPDYTTDPFDDYLVLKHVRETWGWEQKSNFSDALQLLWSREGTHAWWLKYEPGDYSRAALKALGEDI